MLKKLAAFAFTFLIGITLIRSAAAEDEVVFALPAINLGFAPVFIADGLGYWKDAGLAVKMPVISGVGAINAALAGSADFAIATGQTVIRANIRGQKAVIVVSFFTNLAHEMLLAKSQAEAAGITMDSPFEKRASAIKGKKIAVNATNAIPHAYLKMVARKGGLDPDRDVQVAVMSPEASFAALRNGAVDGIVQALPYTLIPIKQGTGVLISSNLRERMDFPELVPQVFNGVVARADLCGKKPTVCRRMVDGFVRGMVYMHEHPKESIDILRTRMPSQDPTVIEEAYALMIKWTPKTARIAEEGWVKTQELAIVAGMIKPEEKLTSFKSLYLEEFSK